MAIIDKIEIPKRTMVLFFVIETSGGMAGSKIKAVNSAIEELIPAIKEISDYITDTQIEIAVLTFSSGCQWMYPQPVRCEDFEFRCINAGGATDFGAACIELNNKMSAREYLSTHSYPPPIVILMMDGSPTDNYKLALAYLKNNKWFENSKKVAVAIGDEADNDVLAEFTGKEKVIALSVMKEQIIYSLERALDDDVIASRVYHAPHPMDSFKEGLVTFEADYKSGFLDKNEKEIVPCMYDNARGFSESLAAIKLNGKWGFLGKVDEGINTNLLSIVKQIVAKQGDEVLSDTRRVSAFLADLARDVPEPQKEALIKSLKNNFAQILKNANESEYTNIKQLLTQRLKEETRFDMELCGETLDLLGAVLVREDQKEKDIKVELKIPCIYRSVSDFSEGLAAVKLNDKCGFIDKTGKEVIPYAFDDVQDFSDGLAVVKLNCGWGEYKCGFIDKTGKEIIPRIFDGVQRFSEGLAAVTLNDKWGFIDKTGKEVIPCVFDGVQSFSEGLAAAMNKYKWGFIDKTGKEVIPCTFDGVQNFSEGLAVVRLDFFGTRWGFIDKTGKEIIPRIFDGVQKFSEGLAAVKLNGKWRFIDKNGKEVIPDFFDDAVCFSEGLAAIKFDGKWGFIDKNGKEIISCIYDIPEFGRAIDDYGVFNVVDNMDW